jgi:hypothetical protein
MLPSVLYFRQYDNANDDACNDRRKLENFYTFEEEVVSR